jgi:hypothetical protein
VEFLARLLQGSIWIDLAILDKQGKGGQHEGTGDKCCSVRRLLGVADGEWAAGERAEFFGLVNAR